MPLSSVPEFRKRLGVAEIKGGEDGALKRVRQTMTVTGWVRTCRLQKTFAFIEVILLTSVHQLNFGFGHSRTWKAVGYSVLIAQGQHLLCNTLKP